MDPSSSSASAQVTLPPPLLVSDAQDAHQAANDHLTFPLATQAQISTLRRAERRATDPESARISGIVHKCGDSQSLLLT